MTKHRLAFVGILILSACPTWAMQAIGTAPTSANVPTAPNPSSLPSGELVHLRGTVGATDSNSGLVRLQNGATFRLVTHTKVFAGGRQSSRYELRPGVTVSADVDLKTGEAKNVWLEK